MKFEKHEYKYGPHFNEEWAMKVVSNMQNEDGTMGAHWTIEQTTSVAQQYGINFSKYNKYDWFVAMNMFYSDFYKAVISMTNSDAVKHYVDLTKAWLEDKDVDEGKMWYYYKYVICDKFREQDDEDEEYEDEYEYYPKSYSKPKRSYRREIDDWDDDDRYERRNAYAYSKSRYMSRY